MNTTSSLRDKFYKTGRVWFRQAISGADLDRFDASATLVINAGKRIERWDAIDTALGNNSSLVKAIARLEPGAKPVRIVAFNKSKDSNWGVPWHQDRLIAVKARHDVSGFRNWTKKSETWHCEPPQEILDQMLFVRVHLDDTDRANGAMQISVGSHARGIVPGPKADTTAHRFPIEYCEAMRGDILVLKMLTLHRSETSLTQSPRRVLRIDFASFDLPAPLNWA